MPLLKNRFVLLLAAITFMTPEIGWSAGEEKPDGEIIISDLSVCQPSHTLSRHRANKKWHLIDYTAEGFSGTLLYAGSILDAPDVTLPLNVSGWYAIHIGYWNAHYAYDGPFKLKLKLSNDPCFQNIRENEPPLSWPGTVHFKETFFKYADLTGQNLIIGQHSKGKPLKASLGYVKLVPLSDSEVGEIKKDRARTDTRMLYALNDGNGLFYWGPTTREDLLEVAEQYRYSDVKALVFAVASGDIVNYPSKIGTPWLSEAGDTVATPGHKMLRDSCQTLLNKGIVPIEVLSEHCHDMGVEVHAMFRLGILGEIPPSDLWENSKTIVRRRPDLRMVDRDGTPIEKASYAYPEVRDYMLGMIREVVEWYDVDGVNLGFNRGPQFVGYEDIFIKDFKAKHGVDPRTLDENEIRVQKHRASYLTEFVRSARALVDEVGKKKGRKIELSAMIYPATVNGREWNLLFGFDFPTWLEEKLMDGLWMYLEGPPFPADHSIVKLAQQNNCKFIANIGGKPEENIVWAHKNYAANVDGFVCWDFLFVQENPAYWSYYRRIGHKDEIAAFAQSPPELETRVILTIDGYDVSHTTNKGADELGFDGPPEMLPLYSGG